MRPCPGYSNASYALKHANPDMAAEAAALLLAGSTTVQRGVGRKAKPSRRRSSTRGAVAGGGQAVSGRTGGWHVAGGEHLRAPPRWDVVWMPPARFAANHRAQQADNATAFNPGIFQ